MSEIEWLRDMMVTECNVAEKCLRLAYEYNSLFWWRLAKNSIKDVYSMMKAYPDKMEGDTVFDRSWLNTFAREACTRAGAIDVWYETYYGKPVPDDDYDDSDQFI